MNTIRVVELLGTPCLLAPERGIQLAAEIKKSIGFLSRVEVDFTGYEFMSSAFLNNSFGQICLDEGWDSEKLHKKVKIKGLDEDDLDEFALAIDNAQSRRVLLRQGINSEQYLSRLPA